MEQKIVKRGVNVDTNWHRAHHYGEGDVLIFLYEDGTWECIFEYCYPENGTYEGKRYTHFDINGNARVDGLTKTDAITKLKNCKAYRTDKIHGEFTE